MPPNTYMWTCPRCKYRQVGAMPSAPANCPRCNFPDAPPTPIADPNAELEAERGPEDSWPDPDADGGATTQQAPNYHPDWVPPEMRPRVSIDRGWMADCVREIVPAYLKTIFKEKLPKDPVNLDWDGVTGGILDRYEGDRPTLLCGCLAGSHGKGVEDMAKAHPERMTG